MKLTNLRRIDLDGEPGMAADFTIADGRQGSVAVSMAEFQAHGEAALEVEAQFVARDQRRLDRYVAPGVDRFEELGGDS